MNSLLTLLVVLFFALPLLVFVILPYWHYRSHRQFEKWMHNAGITNEMLDLAEKANSQDIQQ
jgi:uncharacterized membrane protein YbaN (DUF454 family)